MGTLYPHDIPQHKWSIISIDFVTGLPKTQHQHDNILVVVDKLTKIAHFILGNVKDDAPLLANRFIKEFIRLHGMPEVIISDRDKLFTFRFWTSLMTTLGTKLNFSMAYHTETYGQTKRVNQVMEDMLRMYAMDQPTKWEEYSPLVEFAYNNSYHSSIQMALFEALYGRKCEIPIGWDSL